LKIHKKKSTNLKKQLKFFFKEDLFVKRKMKNIYPEAFFKLFDSNHFLIKHIYDPSNYHKSNYIYTDAIFIEDSICEVSYIVKKVKTYIVQIIQFYSRFKSSASFVKSSSKIS